MDNIKDQMEADFLAAAGENSPADLATIKELASRAVALERDIEAIDEERKKLMAELLQLRREYIPDAMATVGMTEFKLADGSRLKVSNFVGGSLPKEPMAREAAIALIEQHGGEAMIQNELSLRFEKKEHNQAVSLAEELRHQGFDPQLSQGIHHSTLAAWVRELIRHGVQLDWEKLGVYVGRETEITLSE